MNAEEHLLICLSEECIGRPLDWPRDRSLLRSMIDALKKFTDEDKAEADKRSPAVLLAAARGPQVHVPLGERPDPANKSRPWKFDGKLVVPAEYVKRDRCRCKIGEPCEICGCGLPV